MRKQKSVLKLQLIFLLCTLFEQVHAQQSSIDSIVQMLFKSKTEKGIDTVIFLKATTQIVKTTLNDENIGVLEKAGNTFINGNDEYWSYRVKYYILNSLIATDKHKSLAYGKNKIADLEKSNTPNVSIIRSNFIRQLRLPYRNSDMLKEGFQYFNQNLIQSKLRNDSVGLADSYYVLAGFYRTIGLLDQAIYHMKKSLSYIRSDKATDNSMLPFSDPVGRNAWLNNIGVLGVYYLQKGDYDEALKYNRITFDAFLKSNAGTNQNTANTMAEIHLLSGRLDSVLHYLNMITTREINVNQDYFAFALQIKGFYKIKTGGLEEAEEALRQSWKLIEENRMPADARPGTLAPDYYLALIRIEQGKINEAIVLLEKDIDRLNSQRLFKMRDFKLLAEIHERTGNYKKANEALGAYINLNKSLQADQDQYGSLSFETEQEMAAKELSITKLQSEYHIAALTRFFSIGIAALVMVLAVVTFYRFKSKQKANIKLEKTLTELQSTQKQLIQSEKMASLGELTAGIAHEIQNPLNFVNNFSEVNKELLLEMKGEIKKGNLEDIDLIADDLISNEEKISHHGKRADSIVKGMLLHSRSNTGEKELTDLNALADEYFRLAYHGLRAKDQTFNSKLESSLDSSIGQLNLNRQDMGRVLLNLINNAFYAVDVKQKQNQDGYEPQVSITTRKQNGKVELTIKDNGNGIPENIADKIFQPFFTTKPTGQGTGLGLSLAYDIVKAHGGELNVDTKEGEGSEFIIQLPIN